MRVAIIIHSYWPDRGPIPSTTRALAEHLVTLGHTVTVVTPTRSRSSASGLENVAGVSVRRVRIPRRWAGRLAARGLHAALFSVRVAAHVLWRRRSYDLVIVSTYPPILLAAAVRACAAWARYRYIYHLQDLNPEAALHSGVMRSGLRSRLLTRLETRNRTSAAGLVVLSQDMAATLINSGHSDAPIRVINNFMVSDSSNVEVPPEYLKREGVFRAIFAGNLGLVQGLDNVVEAARLLLDNGDIEFSFMGSGFAEESLRSHAQELGLSNVTFLPFLPEEQAQTVLRDADVGIISLMEGINQFAYPSKILAYLEAGLPLLAVADRGSDLADTVVESGAGLACPPGDPVALAGLVEKLARTAASRSSAVDQLANRRFSSGPALLAWTSLIEEIDMHLDRISD
ncbi:MAG: glycosyltransferase family 4 protein [Acidimicrobiia bacterium]|nr:glycosyltransferase family 4 protein [Acidimicrobiia bacterium]